MPSESPAARLAVRQLLSGFGEREFRIWEEMDALERARHDVADAALIAELGPNVGHFDEEEIQSVLALDPGVRAIDERLAALANRLRQLSSTQIILTNQLLPLDAIPPF